MLKKTYLIGFLTATAIQIFPLPVQSQVYSHRSGDRAVNQQSSQNSTVNGNNNHVKQYINVVNVDRRGRGGRNQRRLGNRSVVQNQNQGVDLRGDRNSVRQNGRQFNRHQTNRGGMDLSI